MGKYEESETSRIFLKVRAIFQDKERSLASRMHETWLLAVNANDQSEMNTNLIDRCTRVYMMEIDADLEKWCEALRIARGSNFLSGRKNPEEICTIFSAMMNVGKVSKILSGGYDNFKKEGTYMDPGSFKRSSNDRPDSDKNHEGNAQSWIDNGYSLHVTAVCQMIENYFGADHYFSWYRTSHIELVKRRDDAFLTFRMSVDSFFLLDTIQHRDTYALNKLLIGKDVGGLEIKIIELKIKG